MRLYQKLVVGLFMLVCALAIPSGVVASQGCVSSGPPWCTYIDECIHLGGWCATNATQVCEWYCEHYYVGHTEMESISCSGGDEEPCEADCQCKPETR